jgi:hypothetical protein
MENWNTVGFAFSRLEADRNLRFFVDKAFLFIDISERKLGIPCKSLWSR